MPSRDQFVAYPLDGGLLYFHPQTGTHLRLEGDSLGHLCRQAPRVVMFGITNECNLKCSFCSRDTSAQSVWSENSAFDLLAGLAQAGTLEVAFGGGEPFAFPQFATLLRRLHTETALALHVTTNGTLITEASWPEFAGLFGQVRVSIYNNRTWRRCSELFRISKQLWGANILVDDDNLDTLPELLAKLHTAGCNDVSILGYIGEEARILSPTGKERLAEIVRNAEIDCRVSLCFGDQLPLPRLLAGYDNEGDCGAGTDFVSISSNGQMQSCSFMGTSYPASNADEVLHQWRTRSLALQAASTRSGCARSLPQLRSIPPLPAISVWRGFSGNNSGECVMVAKFGSAEEAEKYLEELLPGWRKISANSSLYGYPGEWVDLFNNEQVSRQVIDKEYDGELPDSLLSIGKTVLATGYGLSDLFPELRALAWKRGAYVAPGGIHIHGDADLFSAISCKNSSDRDSLIPKAKSFDMDCYPYGNTLFVHQVRGEEGHEPMQQVRRSLLKLADGRAHASEIFYQEAKLTTIIEALKRLGQPVDCTKRLWVQFIGYETEVLNTQTSILTSTWNDQSLVRGRTWILLDPVRGRKRAAVLAYRRGASVSPLDARTLRVRGYFWVPRIYGNRGKQKTQRNAELESVRDSLHVHGISPKDLRIEKRSDYNSGISASVLTSTPGQVLLAMEKSSIALNLQLHLSIDAPRPMEMMFRRLLSDLKRPV